VGNGNSKNVTAHADAPTIITPKYRLEFHGHSASGIAGIATAAD
jgi:hypothetical protein